MKLKTLPKKIEPFSSAPGFENSFQAARLKPCAG
jgi:hypothetical protein